jgi:hypothetical protein
MNWEQPELIEINMSAEIGAYQEDFDEREERPAFASDVAPQLTTAEQA